MSPLRLCQCNPIVPRGPEGVVRSSERYPFEGPVSHDGHDDQVARGPSTWDSYKYLEYLGYTRPEADSSSPRVALLRLSSLSQSTIHAAYIRVRNTTLPPLLSSPDPIPIYLYSPRTGCGGNAGRLTEDSHISPENTTARSNG